MAKSDCVHVRMKEEKTTTNERDERHLRNFNFKKEITKLIHTAEVEALKLVL